MTRSAIKKLLAKLNSLEQGNSLICTQEEFSSLFPELYKAASTTKKYSHSLIENPETGEDSYRLWITQQKLQRNALLGLNRQLA